MTQVDIDKACRFFALGMARVEQYCEGSDYAMDLDDLEGLAGYSFRIADRSVKIEGWTE